MKKLAISILVLLLFTGCSGQGSSQTLFVADKNERYGLVDIDGKKQTKFIYDKYESIGNYGYIVVKGKQYGYLSYEGKEIIELGKYTKLESISNMLVGYDKNDNISILNSEGELLYKSSKDTKITLSGLPVVQKDKEYIVLYDTGKELIKDKKEILSANMIKSNYLAICYKDLVNLYDTTNLNKIISVKSGGKYQLMSYKQDRGYLLYDRENQTALACDNEGKIIFDAIIDLDDFYFDHDKNITGVKNQITYLFDDKGTATAINSYYQSLDNYVIKNKEMIYGPHKFVSKGKEVEVNNIQLDPMASHINNEIFPVYVREKGYMYYGFDGKKAIDTIFVSAEVFDQNKLAIVSKEEDKYYLIDQAGKKISKKYYKIIYLGEKYYAGFVSSSKYEVIDNTGKKIINDNFMDEGIVFEYNDICYGIFNKSGTSYVYNINEQEIIFSIEGSLEFSDDGYFVLENGDGYYSLSGEKIYTR